LEIYPDDGGRPRCGQPSHRFVAGPGPQVDDAQGVITFIGPPRGLFTLSPGRYWISPSIAMDLGTRGQWFWDRSVEPHAAGSPVHFDNPGGGFLTPPCDVLADWDMASTLLGRSVDEESGRYGDVNVGRGPAAKVLTVNGSVGRETDRVVTVAAGDPLRIRIAAPPFSPAPGQRHWTFWILDGEPTEATVSAIQFRKSDGTVRDLGVGPRCLPVNNTLTPGACDCPRLGRTSYPLGPLTAARVCLDSRIRFPKYPTEFITSLPPGTYSLGGLLFDLGSPNAMPVSQMNWIVLVVE